MVGLRKLLLGVGLLMSGAGPVVAQSHTEAASPPPPGTAPAPKVLVKAGLRLTHLFYLPNGRNWQVVFPPSLALEYRPTACFSLYAQAETDITAGRGPRARRRGPMLPTSATSLGVGARYYFNQPAGASLPHPERWGNYLALELSTELTQAGRRRGRGPNANRATPAVFAFCGAQHRGPGRLLYDVNAGLGVEAPASATEPRAARSWNVAAQVNLRVYVVNHGRHTKPLPKR